MLTIRSAEFSLSVPSVTHGPSASKYQVPGADRKADRMAAAPPGGDSAADWYASKLMFFPADEPSIPGVAAAKSAGAGVPRKAAGGKRLPSLRGPGKAGVKA